MSDLRLPPPAQEPPPKYMQFPRDMEVVGDGTPAAWMVNHTTNFVWLWIRHPLLVIAQPFAADKAMDLASQIAEHAIAAAELQANTAQLVAVRNPLLGPNGEVIK